MDEEATMGMDEAHSILKVSPSTAGSMRSHRVHSPAGGGGGRSIQSTTSSRRLSSKQASSKDSSTSRSRSSRYPKLATSGGSVTTSGDDDILSRRSKTAQPTAAAASAATFRSHKTVDTAIQDAPTVAFSSHPNITSSPAGHSSTNGSANGSTNSSTNGTSTLLDDFYKVMQQRAKPEEFSGKAQRTTNDQSTRSDARISTSITHSSSAPLPPPKPEATLLEHLPWTEQDNEILRQQVIFWKNCLLDDDERLAKEEVRDLLKTLYAFLRQERATRSDRLLRDISEKLEDLKALDLTKLVQLMDTHKKAGDAMEGKDVILLTGAVGSGKTTTLHFLAGTQFEETEVDGFMHLQPTSLKDSRIEKFTTSCGRDAMTTCLQTIPVQFDNDDAELVICDTPGIGSASTVEEELAFHYGMGCAIERAKRVKPVVVLNQELMGNCFANLPDALRLMKQELSLASPRDLKPVDYIFTHYEERHRTRLHQQFASLKSMRGSRYENDKTALYDELIDDIIAKTTPEAKLVMPLNDDPYQFLCDLWKESFVEEAQDFCYQEPASESALKQLYLQLHITLEELQMALSREVYCVALNRMVILDKLSAWFPQAKVTALLAKEAASRQVKTIWDWMAKEISDSNYEQALCRMEQMSDFGLIFPDAQEWSNRGHELLWESLVAPMDEQEYALAMERIAKLSKLTERFSEANQCVKRSLRLLRKRMDASIETGHFQDALSLLIPLSSLEEAVPEAGECAKSILADLKESVETTIAKKDYPLALHMIRKFAALKSVFPEVGEMAARGMSLCRLTVESSVAQGDYDSALFLVQHMQRMEKEFPQAEEIADYGLKVFTTTIEALIKQKEYGNAILLMKKISEEVPGSEDLIVNRLSQIKDTLKEAIKEQDYTTALEILYEVNNLAKAVPQADACIEYGFKALEENILTWIESQEYERAVRLMELLSAGENRLPLAKECTRVGIEVLKTNVAKAIEKKTYSPALEMIQQLSNKGHIIPEVGECSRRGLEMLGKTAQIAISERDYETAIEIITNLSELAQTLPESKVYAQLGMKAIVEHVTELRQNVETAGEEVAATRDLKVFVALLLKLKSQIEKVMKSEPLRKLSVQIHYKKNFRTNTEEDGVLFVPQLYTSQAFCSDHIELLAGRVREKLPDFDVTDACMETLIRNRKALLSVMIRLKATHKILRHCPGGEKSTAVYTKTFAQFHALLEAVLDTAEESFKPPLDMCTFELQAWFLSVLIKGFIRDKIDVDSDERKQMEELESRRRLLMLQFEVQVTDAVELLSDQDFIDLTANEEERPEEDTTDPAIDENSLISKLESKTVAHTDDTDKITVTKEAVERLDFTAFEHTRQLLISLCQRPELYKMVLKQRSSTEVEAIIKTFDKSLVVYISHMVKYGESRYNGLLDFAKSGASIPTILDHANELGAEVDKIAAQIVIARNWNQEMASASLLDQQRLLILKKRVELVTEKLETTMKEGNEIGFTSFLSNMASPCLCNARWYDDVPTSII